MCGQRKEQAQSQRIIDVHRLKAKEKKEETFQRDSTRLYMNKIYLHKCKLRFSGCTQLKVFTFKKRNLKLQRSQVYTTSAFCSMAEEGMTNSSPAVNGGAGSSATGGTVDATDAAKGEIMATSAGANFFAFLKKALISSRVRPWGGLTFSQSKSAPCAKESAIAPSAPCFRESPFS
jgi:hypothetical protein